MRQSSATPSATKRVNVGGRAIDGTFASRVSTEDALAGYEHKRNEAAMLLY